MEHALLGLEDFFVSHGGLGQLGFLTFLGKMLTPSLNLGHDFGLLYIKQLIKILGRANLTTAVGGGNGDSVILHAVRVVVIPLTANTRPAGHVNILWLDVKRLVDISIGTRGFLEDIPSDVSACFPVNLTNQDIANRLPDARGVIRPSGSKFRRRKSK
jgi:hypothetical protein